MEDPKFADMYVCLTLTGDPAADRGVEDFAQLSEGGHGIHRIISRVFHDPCNMPPETPRTLVDLVEECSVIPGWFDEELALAGCAAFQRNTEPVLEALSVGAFVEAFSTLICRSFRIRGRIALSGIRRLKQSIRQLTVQFVPGGMRPGAGGWRLGVGSCRLRPGNSSR